MSDKKEILKKFFDELKSKKLINGTVLIGEKEEILYEGAFGYANLKSKRELEIDSIFNLASVSKPITAIGMMKLEMYASSDEEFFLRNLSVTVHFSDDGYNYYLTVKDGAQAQRAKRI